ncbi:adenosine deaminase 2 isoform X2 [Wyeomyia smithii]|uniref:adenosine deaminase 2 isoform X2 n=1 Tax=Wyeomyia smithii TaxID=174621 RepID=UPI002467C511|nr:adenosine deaminase 2 isoform X2 [Wyeomyia smithii]
MLRELSIILLYMVIAECATIEYSLKRQAILEAEKRHATGGNAFLTAKEALADEILINLKQQLSVDATNNPDTYAPAMHFFRAKPLIEASAVFKILKAMPKGSVLHLHNVAAVSSEWIVKNLTYRPEAKLCEMNGSYVFTTSISKLCPESAIRDIQKMRAQNGTTEQFDLWLESMINLRLRGPELMTADLNQIWNEFERMFTMVRDLISYKPIFEAFHTRLLEEFYEDNVFYIELRMSLSKIYDASNRVYGEMEVAKIVQQLVDTFCSANPDFIGVKVIFSKHRGIDTGTAQDLLNSFVKLNAELPNLVIGFDLVGQEDINQPLTIFLDELRKFEATTPYFFHAGETNGYGSNADLNLIDAVLLNSRRIGHGYSLYKHPVLWKAVKSKGIALEVCPLSNQVLRLVTDLRNHPAVFFVSESIPIVIASDDPGFWDSKAVSFDYYYAFMAMAPTSAGIGFLKQIVWDSVSSLTAKERQRFSEILQTRWDLFVDDLSSGRLTVPNCMSFKHSAASAE